MILEEKTMKTEKLYEGRILNLRVDTVELPNKKYSKREIIEQKPAVVIIALDEEENVLLVRQYRKAIDKVLVELPAGKMEAGEDPLTSAHRELREETKFDAREMEFLFDSFASPGYTNEVMNYFLATDLYFSPLEQDADENVEMIKVPLKTIINEIDTYQIMDNKSIAGLMYVFLKRREK